MNSHTIDAKSFQKLFLAGANRINSRKDYINELNVFPVPDGDTGTNMSLTILAAAKEVGAVEEPTMATICKAISNGSLRGARGNSGVILSQLFRGFTKAVSKADSLGKDEITAGFTRAVETAYKAVMKPKEGTILTVAKGMADKAEELVDEDMDVIEFCEAIVAYGYEVLSKTPDMLPVLKEAGVVDSGGQGLMEVLQGIVDALTGKVTEIEVPTEAASMSSAVISAPKADISTADIKFGYCTEFIILLDKPLTKEEEKGLKKFFLSIGDSLVLVADEEICKVHVHTNHPGQAFEKALEYGQLTKMKVDNMREEHNQKVIQQSEMEAAAKEETEKKEEKAPHKDFGFVTISAGEGLSEIFKELGVDEVIEGGQTMNPSTEDILNAADRINADTVFVLPNNKNIILAAEQAAELVEGKKLIVIPTKTVPQGITAMINFEASRNAQENADTMAEALSTVATGQLTYAVRDTSIDGKEIHKDDIMGLSDSGLAAVGKSIDQTLLELVDAMMNEDAELITLYYGSDISEEDAENAAAKVEEKYPDIDVELQMGGQPIYYYIVSVE